MLTLAMVENYRDALKSIKTAAASAWGALVDAYMDELTSGDESRVSQAVAELKELLTGVVDVYGDQASALAAELFDMTVDGASGSTLSDASDASEVRSSAGYAARKLFDGETDPSDAVAAFSGGASGAIDRAITDRANRTFEVNGSGRSDVRYARVPTGSETCAFCLMLASRGYVYSADTVMAHVHNGCDCVCVAVTEPIEGYDYEPYAEMYEESIELNDTGAIDTKATLRSMRRRYHLK